MSVKNGFFALVLTLFTFTAMADETCLVQGTHVLDRDTTFWCHEKNADGQYKDLVIEGAQIYLNRPGVNVSFNVVFKSERQVIVNGLKIDAFQGDDPASINGKDAGSVTFDAEEVKGRCDHINLDGYKNGAGGNVIFRFVSYNSREPDSFKCSQLTTSGVGQGMSGDVYAFASEMPISSTRFKSYVIQ